MDFLYLFIVFCLLMNNCHPFVVSSLSKSTSSTNNMPAAKNIVRGVCPYVTDGRGQIASNAPDVDMLSNYIWELFDRAFSYDVTTAAAPATIANRPTAQEWVIALGQLLLSTMTTCAKNTSHVYPAVYPECSWCKLPTHFRPSSPLPEISLPDLLIPIEIEV